MKQPISIIILTRNEEKLIRDCIVSTHLLEPDEILVIDDNSTDATVKIAQDLGVKVIKHQKKNFADARNFALLKAHHNWILYLDADERLTPALISEIRSIIETQQIGAYQLIRENFYLGKRWPATELVTRFFHRSVLKKWYGEVHESPEVIGSIHRLIHPITHYTHRTLSEMVAKTVIWSGIEARLRFEANHPKITWWRIIRVMMTAFWDYYIKQNGWKVGTVGIIESIYQAFSIFITYARLWEMQMVKQKKLI